MASTSMIALQEVDRPSITGKDNYSLSNGDRIDYCLAVNISNTAVYQKHQAARDLYLSTLKSKFGLTIESEKSANGLWECYKINAPFDRLLHEADRLKIKLSIITDAHYEKESFAALAAKGFINTVFYCMRSKMADDEEGETFTAPFDYEMKHKFMNHDNPSLFFTDAQRSLLVYSMLNRTKFGDKQSEVGLQSLTNRGVFTAAYPLHDGPTDREPLEPPANSLRYALSKNWARFSCWFRFQPLNAIRRYYGEQIGLYYAWLGFYTTWLFIPSVVGFLVFLYGLGSWKDFSIGEEVCNSDYIICPICNSCNVSMLSASCNRYKLSWLFDNEASVPFAIFMSLWATLFLEFWKRKNAEIVFDWDVIGIEEEELPRPQFIGTEIRKDPITGQEVEHYPSSRRFSKYIASFATVFTLLACVIIAVVAVIVYRLAVRAALYKSDPEQAASITAFTAALLNLTAIVLLNRIYTTLAYRMTDWENHRTQTNYDDMVTFKIFLFQFVNSYASIFYVAFFKGKFRNVPNDEATVLGQRLDTCPDYGCMLDLTIQLVIIMTGKQVVGNLVELGAPMLKSVMSKKKNLKVLENPTQWERDVALNPFGGLFGEYLEMILQYGFITLFIAAFPLAPLFAFLNNIIEIRLDAVKLTIATRRPPPLPAEDIGSWHYILTIVAGISVVTNAFVIAFTSEFIPRVVYHREYDTYAGYINMSFPTSPTPVNVGGVNYTCHYNAWRDSTGEYTTMFYKILVARLAFVIVFEHFVFFTTQLVAFVIPDIPKRVKLAIAREKYQASRVLGERQLA